MKAEADQGWWNGLLADKNAYKGRVKIDWDLWRDEDDEGDEKDTSEFGGMPGMPGMGGMGGMPGMPGMGMGGMVRNEQRAHIRKRGMQQRWCACVWPCCSLP